LYISLVCFKPVLSQVGRLRCLLAPPNLEDVFAFNISVLIRWIYL